jgi:hypothetical protein
MTGIAGLLAVRATTVALALAQCGKQRPGAETRFYTSTLTDGPAGSTGFKWSRPVSAREIGDTTISKRADVTHT